MEGDKKQMVIDIRVRKCLNVQYDNIHLENIIKMLLENNDIDSLVCIYKGDEYYANIDTMWLVFLASERKLLEYINDQSVNGWVEGFDINRIGELFSNYKGAETILLEKPDKSSKEVLTVSKVEVWSPVNYVDFSGYMKFRQKGIASYIVNIPSEIKNVYGPFCRVALLERWLKGVKNPVFKKEIENDLKRITDLSYDEYVSQVLDHHSDRIDKYESMEAERTIFLIGPCIVEGASPAKETLPSFLNALLEQYHLPYKTISIMTNYFPNKVMEYDICQNDIVIYIGAGLNCMDYDLTEDYEEYDGTKSLCTDITMHASQAGCELIANALMNHIIIPHNQKADALKDNSVLHHAEPNQLRNDIEYEIKMYLKRLFTIKKIPGGGNNGAIVMNANPFTLGHRRLVEYASGQVDQLFVFVVEEDASFFSFEERLEMVCQGIEDMKNVTVLGSGDFIISNKTFSDYFVKELDNEKIVDASQDIFIFARYVVPYLNIKKRFVGEEPTDKITAQYNEQMKTILPSYGCELIEIPRFQENDAVISGSMVRSAIHDKNIDFLHSMLPSSSFHYIYEHLDMLRNRERQTVERKYSICMTDRLHKVNELIETIKQKGTVIIYGIEEDTSTLLKLLRSREKDNLIFVDKQAEQSKIYFMGKEVLAPCELKENYLEYDILILTSKYYREIYFECINMGIDKRRIKYNPYNLYTLFAFKI